MINNKYKKIIFFLVISVSFFSCSSSVEETREEEIDGKEETYVFDEIPQNEEVKETVTTEYYIVQIGAFTTKQRAEIFAEESREKLDRKISVEYSSDVNLFVVRLDRNFTNKKDAEEVRDEIKMKEEFKDAWVVSLKR